jgi:hypothetical protein
MEKTPCFPSRQSKGREVQVARRHLTLEQQRDKLAGQLRAVEIQLADQDYSMPGGMDAKCMACAPFDCDDPDRHLGVPTAYTPLANRGCRCGADFDGRDCMCFEDSY